MIFDIHTHELHVDLSMQVSSGGSLLLAFGGSTSFTSDAVPSGTTQEAVFTGSSHSQDFSLVINGV